MFLNSLLNSNSLKVSSRPSTALPCILRHNSSLYKYYKKQTPCNFSFPRIFSKIKASFEEEITKEEFDLLSILSNNVERPYCIILEGPVMQSNVVELMDTRWEWFPYMESDR